MVLSIFVDHNRDNRGSLLTTSYSLALPLFWFIAGSGYFYPRFCNFNERFIIHSGLSEHIHH